MRRAALMAALAVGAAVAASALATPANASKQSDYLNMLAVQEYMQVQQQNALYAQQQLMQQQADAAYRQQLGIQNAMTLQQMANQNWHGHHHGHDWHHW